MNYRNFILTLCCAAMTASAHSCTGKQDTQPSGAAPATEVASTQEQHHATQAAPLQTTQQAEIAVVSKKMGRSINNTVTLPQQYLEQGDTAHYPVVYLLHGYGDTNASWPEKFDLKQAATQHNIIIVCPDGQNSWYLDSPIDPKMQFETFVSNELVTFMDANYRTRASKQGRAITGLSMGGHGALYLAMRHPEVFGSCGSMSGGVDITKFPDRWQIDKRLGKHAANKQAWADNAVINQLDKIKPGILNIIIDDGRQDFFYEVNMALHAALDKRGIKHSFSIRKGNHSWKYWCVSLPQHLNFFDQAFAGKEVECKTSIDNSSAAQPAAAKPKGQKPVTKSDTTKNK